MTLFFVENVEGFQRIFNMCLHALSGVYRVGLRQRTVSLRGNDVACKLRNLTTWLDEGRVNSEQFITTVYLCVRYVIMPFSAKNVTELDGW